MARRVVEGIVKEGACGLLCFSLCCCVPSNIFLFLCNHVINQVFNTVPPARCRHAPSFLVFWLIHTLLQACTGVKKKSHVTGPDTGHIGV